MVRKFRVLIFGIPILAWAQNPIVPNKGLNDPHIHIFNDTAYVYASHDKSPQNIQFIMEDWWVWSSPDLVNWTQRSVLKPKETYIGKPFQGCWATDMAERDGKYYWYFSERNHQTGVVVGDTPIGPWKDMLNKPLLSQDLTPTHEYDMSVVEDKGEYYIIFGVWDYYIAKLNKDMLSLAEKPRKININNPRGPYNQDGLNKEQPTDDKAELHKYNGKYYLSWGCFYAVSDSLYGPYDYMDTIIKKESFAPGYDAPTWPNGYLQGRHGNFFEWHNQWYFTYCDISQTGNRYFRDAFISYVHYRDDGTIAPIRIDGVGVGRYEAEKGKIEAEDYFMSKGFEKGHDEDDNFYICSNEKTNMVYFPNIEGLKNFNRLAFMVSAEQNAYHARIIVSRDAEGSEVLAEKPFELTTEENKQEISLKIQGLKERENLYITLETPEGKIKMDSFSFSK
ncbi:MAG: family 43 glycosylhydrolase [Bacteroidota bacterium]